jgi:outer membrane protein OmpA-like peptidoglycan-associated protein
MLSSRWLQVFLLSAAVILNGCVVDQRQGDQRRDMPAGQPRDAAGGTPGESSPIIKEPVRPAPPTPARGPVPSAPTTGGSSFYQDQQERVLNDRLIGSGVRVARNAGAIKLIVPGNLAFALNSEQIQPGFTAVLDNVALVLKEYSKTVIDIKGYTDSTGSFEHNQQLSERRAQSIGSYFMARQIGAARIRSAGYGPRYPLAGNDTAAGRNQNRRVEIELVPIP